MRYRLRTLMVLLAVLPPGLWGGYVAWGRYVEWRERQLNQNSTVATPSPMRIIPIPPKPARRIPPEWDYQYPPARR